MLPTIAAQVSSNVDLVHDTSVPGRVATTTQPPLSPPCAHTDPRIFTNLTRVAEAAEHCARCPLASACLAYAIAHDVAYRTGSDHYGVTGIYAGIWFEHGRPPRRVVDLRHHADETVDTTADETAPGAPRAVAVGTAAA